MRKIDQYTRETYTVTLAEVADALGLAREGAWYEATSSDGNMSDTTTIRLVVCTQEEA